MIVDLYGKAIEFKKKKFDLLTRICDTHNNLKLIVLTICIVLLYQ